MKNSNNIALFLITSLSQTKFLLTSVFFVTIALVANEATIPRSQDQLYANEASGMDMHGNEMHSHQKLEIPAGQPIPSVKLIVRPDAMKGWNLEVQVTNFRFAPGRVNTSSNPAEGHAHLFIDGKKITRLYGPWYYLPDLEPGQHEIKVSLNTNTHETLVSKGQPIEATAIVQVPTDSP
jgi:hypothetical protein